MQSFPEYRDLLLKTSFSARIGATVTYRGWSFSGSVDQSTSSSATQATEVLATYSHKLPLVDVHIGVVNARIDGIFSGGCSAASLSASSNSFLSTKLDFTLQDDFSGTCRSAALGASQLVWQRGVHQIDLRGSVNTWKTNALKTDGWSVRFIGRTQFDSIQSLHYHIGYIDSNLQKGVLQRNPSRLLKYFPILSTKQRV